MTAETTIPADTAATTLRAGLKQPRQERSEATLKAMLDARLPAAIEPTLYVKYGNYLLGSALLLSLLVVGRRRFRA